MIAAAVSVVGDDGQVKRIIQLMPTGSFTLRDGRGPHTLKDRAAAEAVVAATLALAGAQELFIDFDHQLIFAAIPGVGGTAEAAGWVKKLEARDDGIWAHVDWTPDAEAKLKQKKYRYISPLYRADKQGNVTLLINAGLTNNPAINGLPAIAASQTPKETQMDLTALAASLGLPATATLAECIAASTALIGSVTALRMTLGIDATGDLVAAAANLKAAKPVGEGDIVVAASAFNEMTARLGALETDKVAASVDAAIVAGKVVPAMRQWAVDLGSKDPVALASYLAATPVVAAAANLGAAAVVDPANGLTSDELVAASSAGLTPEEFAAEKALVTKES